MLKYSWNDETEGTDAIVRLCARCLSWLSVDNDFEPNEHLCLLCRPVGGNMSAMSVREAGIHGVARGITITRKGKDALTAMDGRLRA